MADGKIDVVLEDWDNTLDPVEQEVRHEASPSSSSARNGITAVIGWYIPRYLLKQYPQFKTWRGLKGKETVFKSPESGSQGMFLGGDPSYVQKDRALIEELGLDLKHVVAGAEPAQVARWTQLYKQKKPVLFYWYDPQYLNAVYDLVRIQLPTRFKGCQDDEKVGESSTRASTRRTGSTSCQRRVRQERLAGGEGHPQVQVDVEADQNFVANLISGEEDEAKEKAAAAWVKRRTRPRSTPGSSELRRAAGAAPPPAASSSAMTTPALSIHQPEAADATSLSGPGLLPHPRADRHARARAGLARLGARADGAARPRSHARARGATALARERLVEVYPRRGMFVSGVDVATSPGSRRSG